MNEINSIQPDNYPLVLETQYERNGVLEWARDSNYREDEMEKAVNRALEYRRNWPNIYRGARIIRVSIEVLHELPK